LSERKQAGWVENLRTIVYAVLVAIGVRTFLYEPFNIPSGSMLTTLLIGDYLFVSKFSYGFSRYSLPLGLPLIPGRILAHAPERGDVVVFKQPADNKTDYIKRIIGLPGDQIQVTGGRLYINGQMVPRQKVGEVEFRDGFGRPTRAIQYRETLPNGRSYQILEDSDDGPLDNTPVYQVPPNHFFAMGDNRDNSADSRVLRQVGYIPFENLVGRAEFLFFSTDGSAALWEPWKWPWAIRWERIFRPVGP